MDKVFRYIYENTHLFPPGSVVKHGGAQLSAWASQYKEDMNQMARRSDIGAFCDAVRPSLEAMRKGETE